MPTVRPPGPRSSHRRVSSFTFGKYCLVFPPAIDLGLSLCRHEAAHILTVNPCRAMAARRHARHRHGRLITAMMYFIRLVLNHML